jgi:hypothetical protein
MDMTSTGLASSPRAARENTTGSSTRDLMLEARGVVPLNRTCKDAGHAVGARLGNQGRCSDAPTQA